MSSGIAIVWVSPGEARIYDREEANDAGSRCRVVRPKPSGETIEEFFREITSHLRSFESLVLTGPDLCKFRLRIFFQEHEPGLYRRISGFEPGDSPTPGEAEVLFLRYGKSRVPGL